MKWTILLLISLIMAVDGKKKAIKKTGFFESESDEESSERVSTGFDLSGNLRKKFAFVTALMDPRQNIICSPLSGLMPLGKLAFGADGGTLEELLAAIGVSKQDKLSGHFRDLIRQLHNITGVTLDIASNIYYPNGKRLKTSFETSVSKTFKTALEQLRFAKPENAAEIINGWVKHETRGKIKKVIQPHEISPRSSLIIVNAIYFAGGWDKKFEIVKTGTFHSPMGSQRAPMMSREGFYRYGRSEALGAQLLSIPYQGGASSMLIVLPYTKDGLPILLNQLKLAPEILRNAVRTMTSINVKLSIPKFKIESEFDLGSMYEKIGVSQVFMPSVGLKEMVRGETVYISKAKQIAIIDINEKGTVAAAASSVNVAFLSASIATTFKADHPFLFFILAKGQQLFSGIFVEP